MESRFRRVCSLLSLALSAGLVLAVLGAPAAAQDPGRDAGTCSTDPTGDTFDPDTEGQVDEPRADITELCVEYANTLSVSVRVVEPTNPATDPGWHGGTFVGWFVDTTGDGDGEFFVVYHLNADAELVAEVWEIGEDADDDPVLRCSGQAGYDDGGFVARTIPSACIGNPASVRVQAGMFYDVSGTGDGPVYGDFAPGAGMTPATGRPACFDPAPAPFADRDAIADVHLHNVDCLYELGIALGTEVDGQRYFNPVQSVTRGQFAGFTFRTLLVAGLPAPPMGPAFDDVPAGHTFEEEIRRLAGGDILQGYAGTNRFGPADLVRRDQTASILVRAAEYGYGETLAASGGGYFADTAGNVHGGNIDIAFEQGFVRGTTAPADGQPGMFDPAGDTTRQQMATVLVRYLQALGT